MFNKMKTRITTLGVSLFASASAFATATPSGLPTTAAPTGGSSTDYISTMQNYAFDAFILAGLLIGTIAFIMVAKNCVQVYGEIANGKATFSDMAGHAIAGSLLLVFVVFMLTQASTVLA